MHEAAVSALSDAARAAGLVLALVYLAAPVAAPLAAVVGALGVTTFGRSLPLERGDAALAAAATAVFASSLLVGALRWGTLDLSHIAGAQAVLGPSVLVGPPQAAAGVALAAAAGVASLVVWWRSRATATGRAWSWAELVVWALALASLFWNAQEPPTGRAAGAAVAALAAATFGRLLRGAGRRALAAWLAGAAAASALGAVLVWGV